MKMQNCYIIFPLGILHFGILLFLLLSSIRQPASYLPPNHPNFVPLMIFHDIRRQKNHPAESSEFLEFFYGIDGTSRKLQKTLQTHETFIHTQTHHTLETKWHLLRFWRILRANATATPWERETTQSPSAGSHLFTFHLLSYFPRGKLQRFHLVLWIWPF